MDRCSIHINSVSCEALGTGSVASLSTSIRSSTIGKASSNIASFLTSIASKAASDDDLRVLNAVGPLAVAIELLVQSCNQDSIDRSLSNNSIISLTGTPHFADLLSSGAGLFS